MLEQSATFEYTCRTKVSQLRGLIVEQPSALYNPCNQRNLNQAFSLTVLSLLLSRFTIDSASDKIMMDGISVDGSPIPLMRAWKLIRDDSGSLPY